MTKCSQNTDALKLVREGTSQDGRSLPALTPEFAPVDERTPAHHMVFAQAYAGLIKYFDDTNTESGDWSAYFSNDVSLLLAVPAIEDVDAYQTTLQSWFEFLNRSENQLKIAELKDHFGYLFGAVGSLALAFDRLAQRLPTDVALKADLTNLIQMQVATAFARLIAYHKAGVALALVGTAASDIRVLGQPAVDFDSMLAQGLSSDWSEGLDWAAYVAGIAPDASVFGLAATEFVQINHCSTHTLFKSVFDQFLKVFARVTSDARTALDDSLKKRNSHEPHYALFLSFLRLMEYTRTSANSLTQRHLDFYYRETLRLKEKSALPGHVHLLAELAKQTKSREIPAGALFKAGKDDQGKDTHFANESDFVANQAKVAALRTVYRHGSELVNGSSLHAGRIFASPVANSEDGAGAELTSADGSWHPFFNKVYSAGALHEIRMPEARIGFGIASHYLLLSGGVRQIFAEVTVSGYTGPMRVNFAADVTCHLTTEKGWQQITPVIFEAISSDTFILLLVVGGGDPVIAPYSAKVHGGSFSTDLPLLLVKLKQDDTRPYLKPRFEGVAIKEVALTVYVDGLRTVAASNDFGPLDTSKPFQPFSASPVAGSSLVIGSREIFQKSLLALWVRLDWRSTPTVPTVYPHGDPVPTVAFDFLHAGTWSATSNTPSPVTSTTYTLTSDLDKPARDKPDFEKNEFYSTAAQQGFVRLRLSGDIGQDKYQADLIKFLRKELPPPGPGSKPPVGPTAASLSLGYLASTALVLNTSSETAFASRPGQFFHVTPFGTAEQHPFLNGKGEVFLFPQFRFQRDTATFTSEAELYIGVSGFSPPQNLSLLFQVADGTANPLVQKPDPHLTWSYMRNNEWVEFAAREIQDGTNGLLTAGIVTLSIPRDATNANTAIKSGLHWIRVVVAQASDAVCRLQLVAAQALRAVFTDRGNSPAFPATVLPAGTISKLASPDSAVKSISQPFPSFGGRGAEQTAQFYTRISERLRHRDRAISLWDYERLILEAFPGIYKVKCLNHTCYEPNEIGSGVYRELAPGHVTIVTIPNLQQQNQRDPLKPYTSLGALEEIRAFLNQRTNCFATLHVKNPQFEEVRVKFTLRLIEGYDETYYSNLLMQSITNFLSPWAVAGNGSPTFGGKVYKSVLINFVEEQRYVEYVTDFKLFHDIGGVLGTADRDMVEGSRAVSVLVSVPASKHEIVIAHPSQVGVQTERCSCDS